MSEKNKMTAAAAAGTSSSSGQSSDDNESITKTPEWPPGIPIPETFICPLSRRLMINPVIDKEGNSYERDAIRIYLTATEGISPTNQQLKISDLIENRGLKMAIEVALQAALEQKKNTTTNNKLSRGGGMGQTVLKRFSLTRGSDRGSSSSNTNNRRSSNKVRESRGGSWGSFTSGKPTITNGFPIVSSFSGGGGGNNNTLSSRGSDNSLQQQQQQMDNSRSSRRSSGKSKMSTSSSRDRLSNDGDEELKQRPPTRRHSKKNESFKISHHEGGQRESKFASFTAGITNAVRRLSMEDPDQQQQQQLRQLQLDNSRGSSGKSKMSHNSSRDNDGEELKRPIRRLSLLQQQRDSSKSKKSHGSNKSSRGRTNSEERLKQRRPIRRLSLEQLQQQQQEKQQQEEDVVRRNSSIRDRTNSEELNQQRPRRRLSLLQQQRGSDKSKMSYNSNNSRDRISSSDEGGGGDEEELQQQLPPPRRRLPKKHESYKIPRGNDRHEGHRESKFASFTAGITNAVRRLSMSSMESESSAGKPAYVVVTHEDIKFDVPTTFEVPTKTTDGSDAGSRSSSNRRPPLSRRSSRGSSVSEDELQKSESERPELAMLEHQGIKFLNRLDSLDISEPDERDGGHYRRNLSLDYSDKDEREFGGLFKRNLSLDHSDPDEREFGGLYKRKSLSYSPKSKRSTPPVSSLHVEELDTENSESDRPELAMLEHQGIKFTKRITLDCSDPDEREVLPRMHNLRRSMSYSPVRSTPALDELDFESSEEDEDSDDSKSVVDALDPDSEDELDTAMSEHQDIKFTTLSEYKRKSRSPNNLGKKDKDDFSKSDPNIAVAERRDSTWRRKALLMRKESQGRRASMESATSRSLDVEEWRKTPAIQRQSKVSSDRSGEKSASPDDFQALENNLEELNSFTRALRRDSMKKEKAEGQSSNADDTRSLTADLSWGELSGEIERAQTMSLKSPKNDVKKRSQREKSLEKKDKKAPASGSKEERRKSRRDKSDRKSSERSSSNKKSSDKSSERTRRSSTKSAERKSTKKKSSQTPDKDVDKAEATADHKHRPRRRPSRGELKIDAQVTPSYKPQRSRRRRSRSKERSAEVTS